MNDAFLCQFWRTKGPEHSLETELIKRQPCVCFLFYSIVFIKIIITFSKIVFSGWYLKNCSLVHFNIKKNVAAIRAKLSFTWKGKQQNTRKLAILPNWWATDKKFAGSQTKRRDSWMTENTLFFDFYTVMCSEFAARPISSWNSHTKKPIYLCAPRGFLKLMCWSCLIIIQFCYFGYGINNL